MALVDNIISYYKFDPSNSNDSASTNNGTDTSITYSTGNGKISNGAGFASASSSKIVMGNISALRPNAVTYNLWINASSLPNAYNCMIGKNGAGDTYFCTFYVKSNGKLAVYIITSGGSASIDGTNTTTLSSGTWYMLTMTYDSSAGGKVYVNGSSDGTFSANGTINTNGNEFFLGYQQTYANRYFDGAIDEVGIWSRVLSSTEVSDLYASGSGFQYPFSSGTAHTTERTETVTNTDTRVMSVTRAISETVTNTDTFIKNTIRTVTESITNTDTFSYVMILYKELSETVTSVDNIIRDIVRNISETVTNNDVVNKITARIVSETTTIADTITNMQVKLITLYESLTLIEDFRMFLNSRVARWRDKYNESKTQDWVEKQDL